MYIPTHFTGAFTVNFTAKANDRVKVELYNNMLGMKVTDLLEQTVEANSSYEWSFEKPSLNANDYVLIIRGSKTQQVIRLIQKR